MSGRLGAIAGALCFHATVSVATPPRVVSVEDHLFARNDTTLFLIREFIDNLGSHTFQQTDWILIHRNISNGDDRGFQAVARVVDWGPYADGDRIEPLPLSHAANPYELFTNGDARPLRTPRWPTEVAELTEAGLRFAANDGTVYMLGLPDLEARIEDTLISSRGLLPDPDLTTEPDPFDPAAFAPVSECRPDMVHRMDFIPEDPVLVRLDCEDAETGQQARLWLLVPPRH